MENTIEANNVQERKIYDDFDSLLNNKKRNVLNSVLKIILLSFFALASILILFLAPQTLFANKLFVDKDIQYFLIFTNPTTERLNYIILFRLFFLLGIFLYSIARNFSNILNSKIYTKKYIPWFISYLSFSIVSFILLFTFYKTETLDYYYLSLLSLVLLSLDIAYSAYTYKLKSKLNPLIYKNKIPTIISIISRSIFVISFMLILTIWVFSIKGDKFDFLNNNIVHKFFADMFSKRDIGNLFLIITFIAFLILCFCGMNIERIIIVTSKKYNFTEEKEKYLLWMVFGFSVLIWFIRALFYKSSSSIIGSESDNNNYLYLLGLLVIFLALVLYILFAFVKKTKMKSVLAKTITMSFCLAIIWITISIVSLKSKGILVNNITILLGALITFIIIALFKWNNSSENLYIAFFIRLIIIVISVTLVMNGLNALLLANNNESFYNINSHLSLNKIFVLTTLSLVFTFNISTISHLFAVLFKLTAKNEMLSEAK